MKNFFSFILLVIIIFFLGFGLCFTLDKLFLKAFNPDPPSTQQIDRSSLDRHFFSDDLMVYGKDDQNVPFFLKLSLNRKQREKDQFIHYYFSNFLYGDINKSGYVDFYADTPDISAGKVFLSYQHEHNSDLSARERYDFTLQLKGAKISVSTDELSGDFLIRNSLEYTKYANVGQTKITVNGKSFTGYIFTSSIYSDNYDSYIFFKGYDTVQPLTDYLALWDEKGSFYLIDHTVTKEQNPYYRPHTWILYKDGKDHWMKKAFQVDIDFKSELGIPKSWQLSIPDLNNSNISLEVSKLFQGSTSEGVAKGTVKTNGITLPIGGFVERHN